jgi:hypothetical protein
MEQGPYFHLDEGAPKSSTLLVFFDEQAVKNEKASAAGPPVYDRVVFLRVVAPGQKSGSPIYEILRYIAQEDGSEKQKIDAQVMRRFKAVYDQWAQKQAPAGAGTPLEQWPLMDVALVRAFKDGNVYTVQQLADLPDGALDNIRAKGREWRAKAQSWLAAAKEAGGDAEARAQIERLEKKLEEQAAIISQLQANSNNVGFDRPRRGGKRQQQAGDDIMVEMPEGDLSDALSGDMRL